ncbi:MAG: hypothetical protein K6G09_00935 [Treponema sp.]|nr:hypothetical protein [Treponema sp.]
MVGLQKWEKLSNVSQYSTEINKYHPVYAEDENNPYYSGWRYISTLQEVLQIRGTDIATTNIPNLNTINAAYKKVSGSNSNLIDPNCQRFFSRTERYNGSVIVHFFYFINNAVHKAAFPNAWLSDENRFKDLYASFPIHTF